MEIFKNHHGSCSLDSPFEFAPLTTSPCTSPSSFSPLNIHVASKLSPHQAKKHQTPHPSNNHHLNPSLLMASPIHVQVTIPNNASETQSHTTSLEPVLEECKTPNLEPVAEEEFDYSQRAQWLRAAVLGANDGLITVASLMMGIGAVKADAKAMIIAGFAGLFAGACSMAIGEFVSVYSQRDIELAQIKRTSKNSDETKSEREKLPSPYQAALASALAFSLGAIVPLIAAAFIHEYKLRLGMVGGATTLALVVFGAVGAVLGGTSVVKSCVRVVVGGCLAMGITFGLTMLIDASTGLEM